LRGGWNKGREGEEKIIGGRNKGKNDRGAKRQGGPEKGGRGGSREKKEKKANRGNGTESNKDHYNIACDKREGGGKSGHSHRGSTKEGRRGKGRTHIGL